MEDKDNTKWFCGEDNDNDNAFGVGEEESQAPVSEIYHDVHSECLGPSDNVDKPEIVDSSREIRSCANDETDAAENGCDIPCNNINKPFYERYSHCDEKSKKFPREELSSNDFTSEETSHESGKLSNYAKQQDNIYDYNFRSASGTSQTDNISGKEVEKTYIEAATNRPWMEGNSQSIVTKTRHCATERNQEFGKPPSNKAETEILSECYSHLFDLLKRFILEIVKWIVYSRLSNKCLSMTDIDSLGQTILEVIVQLMPVFVAILELHSSKRFQEFSILRKGIDKAPSFIFDWQNIKSTLIKVLPVTFQCGKDVASAMPVFDEDEQQHLYTDNGQPVFHDTVSSFEDDTWETNTTQPPNNADTGTIVSSPRPIRRPTPNAISTLALQSNESRKYKKHVIPMPVGDRNVVICKYIQEQMLTRPDLEHCLTFIGTLNITFGDKENLWQLITGDANGEVFIDRRMQMFGQTLSYKVTGESGNTGICETMNTENVFRFIIIKVRRTSRLVNQIKMLLFLGPRKFLPKLLGITKDGNDIDVVLSYKEGTTLFKMVHQLRWTIPQIKRFIVSLTEAMGILHRMGVTLRGVKPWTIVVNPQKPEEFHFTDIPIVGAECDWAESLDKQKAYDVLFAGVTLYYLMTGGTLVWQDKWGLDQVSFDALQEEIYRVSAEIYDKVVQIDQTHRDLPAIVHFMLCLLNPNWKTRATADQLARHPLCRDWREAPTNDELEKRLELVNTHGHGNGFCVVTVTDGTTIKLVTTVPKNTPLHDLFMSKSLTDIMNESDCFYDGTTADEENSPVIHSDMVLQISRR